MQENSRKKNQLNFKKTAGYILGLLVFLVLIYIGGFRAIKTTFTPHPGYLVLCFLSMLAVFITSSSRWGFIINSVKRRKACSYFDYFMYFISGRFSGQYVSMPVGDFLLRPAVLKRMRGINLRVGISSALLDKFIDIVFVIVLIGPALLYLFGVLSEAATVVVIPIFGAAVFAFIVAKGSLVFSLLKSCFLAAIAKLQKVKPLQGQIKGQFVQKIEELEGLDVFGKKTLIILIGATIVRYALLVCRIYFLTAALGLEISPFVLFVGIPIAQLALALAVTPGALGVLEGGWYAVLTVAGVPRVDIAAFLIGQRTYWFIFTSAIFLAMYLLSGVRRLQKGLACNGEKDYNM